MYSPLFRQYTTVRAVTCDDVHGLRGVVQECSEDGKMYRVRLYYGRMNVRTIHRDVWLNKRELIFNHQLDVRSFVNDVS